MSEWQPVSGWEQFYEVSIDGDVRCRDGRILKQWQSDQGYMLVRFSKPRLCVRVHRLVARVFVPNPDNKPFVNHLDCVCFHNSASNLEWCTQLENLRHSANLGRMKKDYWKGRRSPNASLSDEQVVLVRSLYSTENWSWQSIGKHVGISKRAVGRLLSGESYANV